MKKILALILLIVFSIQAGPVYALEQSPKKSMEPKQLEEKIDSFMKKNIGKSCPGAAVALSYNGQIILNKGYGLGDIENSIPVNKESVFEYGSISKIFVWISLMQLVEEDKVSLDQDITQYLSKDFQKEWKPKYPITLRDIMNHTTGFGEYPFDLISQEPLKDMSLTKALLSSHPSQYLKPGTASVYSNYATSLGALIVESISGQDYSQYVRDRILSPLQMNTVALDLDGQDNPSIFKEKVQGYKGKDGNFTNTGWSYVPLYPSGSANGKTEDLAKLSLALMSEKSPLFKNSDTLKKFLTPSYQKGKSGTFHGFFDYSSIHGQILGHGGNTASFSSQFYFQPSTGLSLVVLTNAAGEFNITTGLYDLIFGEESGNNVQQGGQSIDKTWQPASSFNGTYSSLRKSINTPFEFISYLQPMSIKAIDDATLEISFSGFQAQYKQVEKDSFSLIDSSDSILKSAFSKLHFSQDQNKQWIAHFGNGLDYLINSGSYGNTTLLLNLVSFTISLLYFFLFPLFLLIQHLRKKPFLQKNSQKINLSYILSISFLCLILVFFLVRTLTNPLVTSNFILSIQVLLYICLLTALISFFKGIKEWKELNNKKTFLFTSIFFFTLLSLLVKWSFLTPIF